jgi:hypothetical protein
LETLKELQKELSNEKKLLLDEINDRNQVIQQLKDTIQEINALTVSEQKYIKKEVKARENSVKLSCSHREAQLIQEKNLLLDKIEYEKLAHEKTMDFLYNQRLELEKSIQEWMMHYETDTEAKSQELEQLKARRTQDLDKFEELVQTYESLEKIVEDDRKMRAQEAEEHKISQKRLEAAVTIQYWFRKYNAARRAAVYYFFISFNKFYCSLHLKRQLKLKKQKVERRRSDFTRPAFANKQDEYAKYCSKIRRTIYLIYYLFNFSCHSKCLPC